VGQAVPPAIPTRKWPTITLLLIAELLGMGVWFSASAVAPALASTWNLDDSGRAWLTMSVQAGFVVGALASAVFNLADRIAPHVIFAWSALAAAASTAAIAAFSQGLASAVTLRLLTGFFLAGVYPVGMKIVATWTKEDRGLGIGLLVGALTIGSAAPHLLNFFGAADDWRMVLYLASAGTAAGGLLAGFAVRPGPLQAPAPPFRWGYAAAILRDRPVLLANLGYLGHMWELYAMWAWIAAYLSSSLLAFVAIAAGGLGSVVAGIAADRVGRTRITILSMAVSGACALAIGSLYHAPAAWLAAVAILWGFAIVADSAQFSACVSELCPREYLGTALTLQTSLGFLLTMLTIRMVPWVEAHIGKQWSFSVLAIGPAAGIVAMAALARHPAARQLASGKG
jgi:MFS family permease